MKEYINCDGIDVVETQTPFCADCNRTTDAGVELIKINETEYLCDDCQGGR